MAKNKVISVEIGYSLTKVCEIDYKTSNPKIHHNFIIPTSEHILKDGVLEYTEEFLQRFKSRLREERIKTKQIMFSISSTKIASREVSIPLVKENRIADVVKANASEYFPIDLSQYQFAYTILGAESDGKGNGQYRLQVLAAPNALLEGYKKFADALGLSLVALDYNGNSLYNAVKSEQGSGTQVILQIEERNTLIMVVKDNMVILNRSVAYGVDDALQAMIESNYFPQVRTYYNALNLVAKETCIFNSLNAEEMLEEAEAETKENRTKRKITNTFSYLIGGISRVLDYYNSRNMSNPIEKIQITGLGSGFKGLDALFTNELATDTQMLETLEGIQNEESITDGTFGEYISCFGAAVNPVDFISGLFETKAKGMKKKSAGTKKGEKGEKTKDYDLICKIILGGGLLIALVLIVLSVLPYAMEKKTNKELLQKITQLEVVFPLYEQHENAKLNYDKMVALDGATKNQLRDLNRFFTDLEQNMPSSFALQTFSVNPESISMDVSVDSKAAAAKAISEIESFPMVASVNVSSVFEQESEIGEMKVAFSATVLFQTEEEIQSESTAEAVAE